MGVVIDEVSSLEPGHALYVFSGNGLARRYVKGEPPKNQLGVDCVMRDAFDRYESLDVILMSPQDFKMYNDGCVAKETIKL